MPTHKTSLRRVSISQLHELTGRSREWISRRLGEAGCPPVERDGKTVWHDPRRALPVLYGVGDGLDLNAERARLAKEQADAQELKNAQLRGELVPAGDQEAALVAIYSATSKRLQGVPSKVAPLAHGAATVHAAESEIRERIEEALHDLADAARSRSA